MAYFGVYFDSQLSESPKRGCSTSAPKWHIVWGTKRFSIFVYKTIEHKIHLLIGDREKKVLGVCAQDMSNRYNISLSGARQWVGSTGIIALPSHQLSYPAIIH